jgi:hypothetical protein
VQQLACFSYLGKDPQSTALGKVLGVRRRLQAGYTLGYFLLLVPRQIAAVERCLRDTFTRSHLIKSGRDEFMQNISCLPCVWPIVGKDTVELNDMDTECLHLGLLCAKRRVRRGNEQAQDERSYC